MNVQDVNFIHTNRNQIDGLTRNLEKKDSKLYEACQDFEALFIKQMLNSMRKTVNKTGMMQGGMAEDVFEDMLYDEYAKTMSRTARLGLSDLIYKQVAFTENKQVQSV